MGRFGSDHLQEDSAVCHRSQRVLVASASRSSLVSATAIRLLTFGAAAIITLMALAVLTVEGAGAGMRMALADGIAFVVGGVGLAAARRRGRD